MMRTIACFFLCGLAGAEVKNARFANRDVWTMDTAALRVSVTHSGGHIVEIALKDSDAVNPLWVQKRPTIDAEQYSAGQHEKVYGGGPGARLMAGLLGHNICFPFWGNPSDSEYAAGMTYHGETGVTRWRLLASTANSMTVSAELPETMTRFSRTIRVAGQVAVFESTGENRGAWDRPVGWCEHVTLGPPFLEKGVTRIDASLTRGRNIGEESGQEFRWPEGQAESKVDLRTVRNIEKSAFVNNFLVDQSRELGYFTAVHPAKRVLIGYIFPRKDFPWLNIWEANNPDMLTRGMEFSNTPTHGTFKALVKAKPLFDTPLYEWLDAHSRMTKRFATFSTRVPPGYRGVADVRISAGTLEIVEEGTGKTIALVFPGW
jgi:hypothetical protein